MNFVPMKAEHVLLLGELVSAHSITDLTAEMAVMLEDVGGVTAIHEGEVLGIAGIMPKWEGSGVAWAWLSRGWLRHARAITEEIQRALDASELDRVELAVKVNFDRGHRWARRLGFILETECARKWGPDGASYSIYARVK